MNQILDNITWFTLTGPHAVYATGAKDARRYAAGFSPSSGLQIPRVPTSLRWSPGSNPMSTSTKKWGFETTARQRCA